MIFCPGSFVLGQFSSTRCCLELPFTSSTRSQFSFVRSVLCLMYEAQWIMKLQHHELTAHAHKPPIYLEASLNDFALAGVQLRNDSSLPSNHLKSIIETLEAFSTTFSTVCRLCASFVLILQTGNFSQVTLNGEHGSSLSYKDCFIDGKGHAIKILKHLGDISP